MVKRGKSATKKLTLKEKREIAGQMEGLGVCDARTILRMIQLGQHKMGHRVWTLLNYCTKTVDFKHLDDKILIQLRTYLDTLDTDYVKADRMGEKVEEEIEFYGINNWDEKPGYIPKNLLRSLDGQEPPSIPDNRSSKPSTGPRRKYTRNVASTQNKTSGNIASSSNAIPSETDFVVSSKPKSSKKSVPTEFQLSESSSSSGSESSSSGSDSDSDSDDESKNAVTPPGCIPKLVENQQQLNIHLKSILTTGKVFEMSTTGLKKKNTKRVTFEKSVIKASSPKSIQKETGLLASTKQDAPRNLQPSKINLTLSESDSDPDDDTKNVASGIMKPVANQQFSNLSLKPTVPASVSVLSSKAPEKKNTNEVAFSPSQTSGIKASSMNAPVSSSIQNDTDLLASSKQDMHMKSSLPTAKQLLDNASLNLNLDFELDSEYTGLYGSGDLNSQNDTRGITDSSLTLSAIHNETGLLASPKQDMLREPLPTAVQYSENDLLDFDFDPNYDSEQVGLPILQPDDEQQNLDIPLTPTHVTGTQLLDNSSLDFDFDLGFDTECDDMLGLDMLEPVVKQQELNITSSSPSNSVQYKANLLESPRKDARVNPLATGMQSSDHYPLAIGFDSEYAGTSGLSVSKLAQKKQQLIRTTNQNTNKSVPSQSRTEKRKADSSIASSSHSIPKKPRKSTAAVQMSQTVGSPVGDVNMAQVQKSTPKRRVLGISEPADNSFMLRNRLAYRNNLPSRKN